MKASERMKLVKDAARLATMKRAGTYAPQPPEDTFAYEYENRQDATFHAAFHGLDDNHYED